MLSAKPRLPLLFARALRGLFLPWLFLFLAVGAILAQPTLPNGLQLMRFEVRAPEPAVAGGTVYVEMTLRNDSGQRMQFDRNIGIFVGARVNSTSDANSRDFGHAYKGLVLAPGAQVTLRASRPLDAAGEWRFWPAFRLNGQWGPFRWNERTVLVYATAAEARRQGGAGPGAGTVTVAQLLANAARFDGKRVTVTGDALIVRRQTDSSGRPWTLMSMVDIADRKKVMNVIGTGGHAALGNGDVARATGVFKMKSPRGRYTYDNELICESSAIVRDQRRSEQKLADERNDNRQAIDLRAVLKRPFDTALLRGRIFGVGAEIPAQFRTRTYSQTPRRNTIVATGRGTAAIRVEKVERRQQVGGRGSTTAGPGNTFVILRLSVRGNAANAGEPENFHQSVFYFDVPPAFALTGRGGAVYWPDAVRSSTVTYSDRGSKPLGEMLTRDGRWTRSGLVFKVPETIQDPVLVIVTHQGGDRFEYAGVRVY
jgi:hypothetical protein